MTIPHLPQVRIALWEQLGGVTGISTPVGNYVRYEYHDSVLELAKDIRHEWFHDYERKTQWGFDIGYVASIAGVAELYDIRGEKTVHDFHPEEVIARNYAGKPSYPWGDPELRPFWKEGIGKDILDWLRVHY